MVRRRPQSGFRAGDGAAVFAALAARHDELRAYCAAVGIEWRPLDAGVPVTFYGWQLPADLRRGVAPNTRCELLPDGTVAVS